MRGARLERFKFAIYVISACSLQCAALCPAERARCRSPPRRAHPLAQRRWSPCTSSASPRCTNSSLLTCVPAPFLRAVGLAAAPLLPPPSFSPVLASRASSCRVLRSPRAAAVHSRQGGRARGYCGRGCRVSAQARRRGGCCRSRNRTASSTAAQVANMSPLVLSVLQQCRYSQ